MDYDHAVAVGAMYYAKIATDHTGWFGTKWTTYKYIARPTPHDGVVPVSSQYLDPSKGENVIIPAATIKGAHHQEECNHPNTKKVFDDVLNGRSYSPQTFQNTIK